MSLTDEQKRIRMSGIGASEVASIVGLNPYRSAHDVYCLKLGLVTEEDSVVTRMGSRVEACVRAEYIEQTGAVIDEPGTVRHPTEPWMLATPDGIVRGARRGLEIKCVGWRSAFHWGDEDDAIPDYYRPQVAWQMAVCDLDEVHVAAWIGGADFRIYTVRRNLALEAALVDACREFWFGRVLTQTPPAIDGSEGARNMLAALYPRNTKPLTPATPEHEDLIARLVETRARAEQAEREAELAAQRIKQVIGEGDGLIGEGWKATWKTTKTGSRPFKFTTFEKKAKAA